MLAAAAALPPVLLGVGEKYRLFSGRQLLHLAVCAVAILLYITLHELTHGAVMKACGASVRYGFRAAYAYAGSDAYFTRRAYIVIALAPVVLWGVLLGVLCAVLPAEWFWTVHLIQIVNLSGAAGDLYCAWRTLRSPRDTLVRDTGTAMTFYTRNN